MPVDFSVEGGGTMTAEAPMYAAYGSAIPMAFASISYEGQVHSGTSNVAVFFNKTTRTYEITLSGVKFDRTQYTAVATVSGWNGRPLFINTDDSADGKLLVDLRDVNGALGQADFQFVVFTAH